MPSLFDLTGEVAFVTGGATGLGAAIALALAQCGARVVITINSRPADDLLAEAKAQNLDISTVAADLAALTPERAEQLLADVEAVAGSPTILVNNAGIIRRAPALEFAASDWHDILDVDLNSVWTLSQAAGRRMTAGGHGRIVNIASLLAFQGGIRIPAYTAAKHAVAGLTKALANEWAPLGVTVNAVAPGYIDTDAIAPLKADEKRSADILARIPMGDWGRPSDIGGAVAYLASPAARYVNGHILVVDGGWMSR